VVSSCESGNEFSGSIKNGLNIISGLLHKPWICALYEDAT
jgi:hypothetical protein